MMSHDLPQLLQQAVAGDVRAITALLELFKTQQLTAAEQENVHAYLNLASHQSQSHYAIYLRGKLYEYGYGVTEDLVMSFLLMREAAAAGNSAAIYEVGQRFLEGIGVPQQYDNALQWLTLAAGSPYYHADAMQALGRMYEEGLGVEVDQVQAEAWYQKAGKRKNG